MLTTRSALAAMLNNVFPRGTGVAEGIDYGLSERNHKGELRSVEPRVLAGDPEAVKAAVRTLMCRQRYTAGILSFAEKKLPEPLKRQIIQEHLQITFPGFDPTRIAATYIEHGDEGFCEIHYWIANVDLQTGKRINAYFHRADRQRLRLWCQSVNDRHHLADPNDPRRWRLSMPPKKDAPDAHKTIQAKLLAGIEKMALAGVVKSRADIEAALIQAGWAISRRTKNFISVLHTRLKKPIRLNGRIFAADWNGTVSPDAIEKLAREWAMARTTRLRETAAALVSMIENRANYNRERFGGAHCPDPLLRVLIEVRDTLTEPSPKDALAALHADLATLKARLGAGGTSLQKLGAQTRRQLAMPPTSAPSTDQPTPIHGGMKL